MVTMVDSQYGAMMVVSTNIDDSSYSSDNEQEFEIGRKGSVLIRTNSAKRAAPIISSSGKSTRQSERLSSGGPRARSFKRSRFLRSFGSKETFTALSAESGENLEALTQVVGDRIKRNSLVHSLLALGSDASIKVRFLAAIREYENTKGRVDRKCKGRKIISLFVHNGSMFQIQNIPRQMEQTLLSNKLDALADLKEFVLQDLIQNEKVMDAMRRVMEDDD